MGKLLLIGASLLAFHGGGHHQRYWWPAMDLCNTGTVPPVCIGVAGHWSPFPPPRLVGSIPAPPASPGAMCGPVYCRTGKPDF